jgi:hypothetical protein
MQLSASLSLSHCCTTCEQGCSAHTHTHTHTHITHTHTHHTHTHTHTSHTHFFCLCIKTPGDKWLDEMSDEVGPYYAYNLYDDCGPNGQADRHTHRTWREHNAMRSTLWATVDKDAPPGSVHDFGYPCGKQAGATAWLNDATVRAALNVPNESFYGHPFSLGTHDPSLKYTRTVDSLVDTYVPCVLIVC